MKSFKWLGMACLALLMIFGTALTVKAQEVDFEDEGVSPVLTIKEKLGLTNEQVAGLVALRVKAKAEIKPLALGQILDLGILKKKVDAGASDAELKLVLGRLALRDAQIRSAKGKYWGLSLALLNPTQKSKVVLGVAALYLDALKTVGHAWSGK